MLQLQEYTISYRLPDGTRVERWYQHHLDGRLKKDMVLTPDQGWLYDPVKITEIACHPDDGLLGSAQAELYEPPEPQHDEDARPDTPVESL